MVKLDSEKIRKNLFVKFFTFLLIYSVFVQPFFVGDIEQSKVLCFGNNGHIAIENVNETCTYCHHYSNIRTYEQKDLPEISTQTDDKRCIDVFISTISIFENKNHNSKIHFSFPFLKIDNSFPNIIDFNKTLINYFITITYNKILKEISTVLLLL